MGESVISTVRGLAKSGRERLALRHRRLPRFTTTDSVAAEPTVYYFAPDLDAASGGIRNIYRHVDELGGLGIRAAVMHTKAGFRCTWFANNTTVRSAGEIAIHHNDLLVMPEFYGPSLHTLPADVNVVIFNQKAYDTFFFTPFSSSSPGAPYAQLGRLRGLLTVSQDNADVLRYAFPNVGVEVARLAIDPAIFHPGPGPRRRRIAFTTHRRAAEKEMLLHLLRARGVLDGWELVPIVGKSERETAEIMRSTAVFLSFSEREGFGLPPAEAMASGCYVVGFTGLAGREFFDPEDSNPVPDADVLAFAAAVERACARFDSDPDAFAKLGAMASDRILTRYTLAGLRDDLDFFYRPLLAPQ